MTTMDVRGRADLSAHGIQVTGTVVWQPTTSQLYEDAVRRGQGRIETTDRGFSARARDPNDETRERVQPRKERYHPYEFKNAAERRQGQNAFRIAELRAHPARSRGDGCERHGPDDADRDVVDDVRQCRALYRQPGANRHQRTCRRGSDALSHD